MNLIPFDDYKIAGMAVMYTVNYAFDITKIFPLLPVAWDRLDSPIEDDITSIKYGKYQRGCESVKKGCMKNMIMLRMCAGEGQMISIKFNSDKIHICGTKEYDTPYRVCQRLLNRIDEDVLDIVQYIQDNEDEYRDLVLDCYDEDLNEFVNNLQQSSNITLVPFIENQVIDYINNTYGSRSSSECLNQLLTLPFNIDMEDIPERFRIVEESTNMLNYNYDLSQIYGSSVRLVRYNVLNELVHIRNCVIHADNRLKQNITIQIRSQDGHLHRLILNRNGKIIHSSHDRDSMGKIYYQLLPILLQEGCIEPVDEIKNNYISTRSLLGLPDKEYIVARLDELTI